jgi:hypothetical protein
VLLRRFDCQPDLSSSSELLLFRHVFPICLIAICGAAVFVGAVPTHVFGHDAFFLLDNGWRIVKGQRPHVDYASPWGPLSFLVVASGLVLSGHTVDGIGYGSAVAGLIIGAWAFRLGRTRLEPLARVLLSLYLVVLTVAPYPLGLGVLHTGHAMVYNRYGYALLGLVILESFARARGPAYGREDLIGALSTGAVIALALFLKTTYFFVGLLLVATSLLEREFCPKSLSRLLIGFLATSTAFLIDLDFDLSGMLRDLAMAAGARQERLYLSDSILKVLTHTPYLLLLAWVAVQVPPDEEVPRGRQHRFAPLLAVTLVFAAEMLLLCTNQQPTELALLPIFFLLAASRVSIRRRALADQPAHPARLICRNVMAVAGVIFLVHFALGCAGLTYGVMLKASPPNLSSVERFTEPRLAPLILYDEPLEPASNGREYTTYVNDGIRLLRENTDPGDTILTMDMFNPFPFALGRRPAVGGIAAAAYCYTLSDTHHPSDDRFFGNADIVMVPKQPAVPGVYFDGFYRIYEAGLHNRFRITAESPLWYLYKRK